MTGVCDHAPVIDPVPWNIAQVFRLQISRSSGGLGRWAIISTASAFQTTHMRHFQSHYVHKAFFKA